MHIFSPLPFVPYGFRNPTLRPRLSHSWHVSSPQSIRQHLIFEFHCTGIWPQYIYFFPFFLYCTSACLPLSPEPKHAILSLTASLITILSSILLTGTLFHKTIYQNLNYHHGARFNLDIPTRVPIIAPDHISCCDRVNHNYCESCLLNTLTGWIINHSSP